MAMEWIESLAGNIKQNARESAEAFGRQQHRSAIITERGSGFFRELAVALENNVNEIRRQLQGDVTSSETTFVGASPTEVKLTRSRFPWFDAVLTYQDPIIVLRYAKGPGVAADPVIAQNGDREIQHFQFQVDDSDALSIEHAFDGNPQTFRTPEELAQHITQLLFSM